MNTNKSPNKTAKSSLGHLLIEKTQKLPNRPALVPPVLQQVGKLAAGVANVSTDFTSSGSATGNPRNKTALQPGHSLMDWIRLGASGKDLAGVGPKAGHLSVTKQELSTHNRIDDIWIAIRGKVYNMTAYIPFHPGGPDELMRAAGIDATTLFDQVHPWVNYEQILQKCFIGRLVSIDPNTDIDALFFGKSQDAQSQSTSRTAQELKTTLISVQSSNIENRESTSVESSSFTSQNIEIGSKTPGTSSSISNRSVDSERRNHLEEKERMSVPRFDWIQKLDNITLIFYTKAYCNPLVEVCPPIDKKKLTITLTYERNTFKHEVELNETIVWPGTINVNIETGKIELTLRKSESKVWGNFGKMSQQAQIEESTNNSKYNFIFRKKIKVTDNTYLMMLERTDGCKMVTPLGYHVRVFVNIDGQEMSRSYTPVPLSLFTNISDYHNFPTTDSICFMVKRYVQGRVSTHLTERAKNDLVYITKPIGDFEIMTTERKNGFLMLAGGTGITPMTGLIQYLLSRRAKKCQFLKVLFFNRTEADIPFRNQFHMLSTKDSRFSVDHILSQPDNSWSGLKGHVDKEMINSAISEHIKDTGYTIKDIFLFICGPTPFVTAAVSELEQLNISQDQMYVFQG